MSEEERDPEANEKRRHTRMRACLLLSREAEYEHYHQPKCNGPTRTPADGP